MSKEAVEDLAHGQAGPQAARQGGEPAGDAGGDPEVGDPEATQGSQTAPQAEADPQLDRLREAVASLRDRLARARADYDNLQKRMQRDAALERDRVKARVLEDFLQVYEYGQMARFEAERNPGPLADGVKMVVREFDRLLENNGVATIGEVGEPYDRTVHEAVATEPAPGVAPGHVSRIIAQGYRLGERVLRYAKVAVAPEADEEE